MLGEIASKHKERKSCQKEVAGKIPWCSDKLCQYNTGGKQNRNELFNMTNDIQLEEEDKEKIDVDKRKEIIHDGGKKYSTIEEDKKEWNGDYWRRFWSARVVW